MDIITIALLIVLPFIALAISSTYWSRVLFGLVVLYIGMMIQIGGITYTPFVNNATNYTIVATNTTVSFILMLLLIFGSILSIIVAVAMRGKEDEEV
jgi:hypothetical protein